MLCKESQNYLLQRVVVALSEGLRLRCVKCCTVESVATSEVLCRMCTCERDCVCVSVNAPVTRVTCVWHILFSGILWRLHGNSLRAVVQRILELL